MMRQVARHMDNAIVVYAEDGSVSFAFAPDAFNKETIIREDMPFAGIPLKLTTFRKEEIDGIIAERERLMNKWKVR